MAHCVTSTVEYLLKQAGQPKFKGWGKGSTSWRLSKSRYKRACNMGKIAVTSFQISHRNPYGTCCLWQSILKPIFLRRSHFFSIWFMDCVNSPVNVQCAPGLETFSAFCSAPLDFFFFLATQYTLSSLPVTKLPTSLQGPGHDPAATLPVSVQCWFSCFNVLCTVHLTL